MENKDKSYTWLLRPLHFCKWAGVSVKDIGNSLPQHEDEGTDEA